jgi:hypothetical protein
MTEVRVHGGLIDVCKPNAEVVDITQLLNMTTEERHIRALPVSMQRFMAAAVLAGYHFEYRLEGIRDVWYAWDPTGVPTGARGFTGLMFALDRIGFNDWLRYAAEQQLKLY